MQEDAGPKQKKTVASTQEGVEGRSQLAWLLLPYTQRNYKLVLDSY